MPDRARRKSFGIGVTNDLIKLNSLLFGYFDQFLKGVKHSPSSFQEKIHSCSLSEDEVNLLLQNKIIDSNFDFYPQFSQRLVVLGKTILDMRTEIDETIKRLYSFNMYLSSKEIDLLRSIHEKVFRYSLKLEATTSIGNVEYRVQDPSLAYMSKVLIELQDNYRDLRKIIFKNPIFERSFVISKIQAYFYSSQYQKCISLCSKWIAKFPFDSDLQIAYKAKALFRLDRKNEGYAAMELLLAKDSDIVSQRNFFYPILSDPVAYGILIKKVSNEKVEEMKRISESELLQQKALLASNAELKSFYASVGR